MMDQLHAEHTRMMISIWPNMDAKSANYQQFKERDLLIPGSDLYNAFDPKARSLYWEQVCEQLYPRAVVR